MTPVADLERVNAVYYDGTNVHSGTIETLPEVPEFLEVHSGAQIWIDVRTFRIAEALSEFDVADPGTGPVIQDEMDRQQTVMAYTHTVSGSRRLHRTVLAAIGPDLLVTVHDSVGDTDSKQILLEYLSALVEKELSDVPKAILYFREMLMATVLDAQADEFIATLQGIVRELSLLQTRLEQGEVDTKDVQNELFNVHMFIEDAFPAALLSFREVLAKLRRGAGKNVDLKSRHHELEDVLRDVDSAVAIKANVEKTIDLVNQSMHTKLTERTLESQRRLQIAVWVLTQISVFLVIPMLVLNFWRLTPWVGENKVDLLGMEIHGFLVSLLVAAMVTLLALLFLNFYLRRRVGALFVEGSSSPIEE